METLQFASFRVPLFVERISYHYVLYDKAKKKYIYDRNRIRQIIIDPKIKFNLIPEQDNKENKENVAVFRSPFRKDKSQPKQRKLLALYQHAKRNTITRCDCDFDY